MINLSLGSDEKELVIEQAIYAAVRKGTLVVAAAGNDGEAGNPLGYPASMPHVLTVGCQRSGRTRSRASRAAPGSSTSRRRASTIPIATALGKGWRDGDGTSFAAPLVPGASAWVWTARPELDATQLFEVMRRSAVDIGAPGRDDAAGFGLLERARRARLPGAHSGSVRAERRHRVRPARRLYDNAIPPLTTRRTKVATVQARLDRVEDPRDVYRVWLPRERRITATVTADTNVDLGLWKQGTVSVASGSSAGTVSRARSRREQRIG